MSEFLIVRRDKETGELANTFTLSETLSRLVPSFYQDAAILEQAFRDDQLVQTPFSEYFALNGQYDQRKRIELWKPRGQ